MKRGIFVGVLLLWFPLTAVAGPIQLYPNLTIELPELPAPWTVTKEPPRKLIDEVARDVQQEARSMGRKLSDEQAMKSASKRLSNEDLFLVNPQSGAHVLLSFEPLGKDEAEPRASDIAMSAKYAAHGVSDEGWTDVSEQFQEADVAGARYARRFEIDFSHEGGRHRFTGIVGYARPYWFWLYATDHLRDPADQQIINAVLQETVVHATP